MTRRITARLCVHHQVCINVPGGVVALQTRPCADGVAGMDVLLTEQSCAVLLKCGTTPQKVIHGLQARVRARGGDFLLGTYSGEARYGAGGERDPARWLKAAHLAEFVRGGRVALPHAAALLSALAGFGDAVASPREQACAAAAAPGAAARGAAVPEAETEEELPAAPRVRKLRAPAGPTVPKRRAASSGSASAAPTPIEVFVPAPELGASAAGPVGPCLPSAKETEKPATRTAIQKKWAAMSAVELVATLDDAFSKVRWSVVGSASVCRRLSEVEKSAGPVGKSTMLTARGALPTHSCTHLWRHVRGARVGRKCGSLCELGRLSEVEKSAEALGNWQWFWPLRMTSTVCSYLRTNDAFRCCAVAAFC
jgi:hypothetical protein